MGLSLVHHLPMCSSLSTPKQSCYPLRCTSTNLSYSDSAWLASEDPHTLSQRAAESRTGKPTRSDLRKIWRLTNPRVGVRWHKQVPFPMPTPMSVSLVTTRVAIEERRTDPICIIGPHPFKSVEPLTRRRTARRFFFECATPCLCVNGTTPCQCDEIVYG